MYDLLVWMSTRTPSRQQVAEPDGEVRSLGIIPNRLESIRKLVAKLGPAKRIKACYEAGPTGYVLYWQLTTLGVPCAVIAPRWCRSKPAIG